MSIFTISHPTHIERVMCLCWKDIFQNVSFITGKKSSFCFICFFSYHHHGAILDAILSRTYMLERYRFQDIFPLFLLLIGTSKKGEETKPIKTKTIIRRTNIIRIITSKVTLKKALNRIQGMLLVYRITSFLEFRLGIQVLC